MKKRRRWIAGLFLSLLFLGCIIGESYRRGYFEEKKGQAGTKEVQEEQKGSSQKGESGTKKQDKKENGQPQMVRVLLSQDNYVGYYHETVKVTSKYAFSVTIGKKVKKYKSGQSVCLKRGNKKLKGKRIVITPSKGQIEVLSLNRLNRHPSYRGTLRVTWKKNGFLLVNTLPVEQYLYAVVPSELSTSNKLEALKAQAVCARNFVYNQIAQGRFQEYGADVDDSVACQVYNNIAEDARSRKAVNETKDIVMTSGGKLIAAYYFSTTWGYTASAEGVWNTGKVSYLQCSYQGKTAKREANLTSERTFADYIRSNDNATYDSGSEWYRWSVTIGAKQFAKRVMSALYSCAASNPDKVLIQKKNGKYRRGILKKLGKISKIRVEKREKSGIVTEIVLVGKNQVVKVCDQYNVRKVLAPVSETITRENGGDVEGYSMLPSAAFTIRDVKKDKDTAFLIEGGGFGHGCGMSQEGAAGLAKEGAGYKKILRHYYSGVKFRKIEDVNWN